MRYLPVSAPPAAPLPLVVFLHGAGSNPAYWQPLLEPLAEELGCALLLPRALDNAGFGVGDDAGAIDEALARTSADLTLDPTRLSLAGHSAGGAFAYVLAYGSVRRFAALFTLSAPYRQVLGIADADYTAPIRMYYGTLDPNYSSAFPFLRAVWERLGVRHVEDLQSGGGHNTWDPATLGNGFRFLLGERYGTPGGCLPSGERLCVLDGRFAVTATWHEPSGRSGDAGARVEKGRDSGNLWFFSPDNWELLVKVLDGCVVNQRFWVFLAATTDVEFHLAVTDLRSGQVRRYDNALGHAATPVLDTSAFATCP